MSLYVTRENSSEEAFPPLSPTPLSHGDLVHPQNLSTKVPAFFHSQPYQYWSPSSPTHHNHLLAMDMYYQSPQQASAPWEQQTPSYTGYTPSSHTEQQYGNFYHYPLSHGDHYHTMQYKGAPWLPPPIKVPQTPTYDKRVLEQIGPVCPLMVAMMVSGIPVVPVVGIGLGSVRLTAQRFMEINPRMDVLWKEEMEDILASFNSSEEERYWSEGSFLAQLYSSHIPLGQFDHFV